MFQSIASSWPLLCWNKKGKQQALLLVEVCLVLSCPVSCPAERDRNACREGSLLLVTRQILKAVLTFQTLMLATLGKWATTHNRVFILGKNCSWTLLPGSTWLWTPITRLCQSSVRSYRTHFASLKRVDDLRVYWGFMMPLNHQAGYKVR